MFQRFVFATLLIAASSGTAWADSIQVLPAAPRYFETVYLQSAQPSDDYHMLGAPRVAMQGTTITVDYNWGIDIPGLPGGPPRKFTVMLGKFPAGTYTVQANLPTGSLTTQFTVSPKPGDAAPFIDFSGLWWDPAESGWGLSIAQGPTNQLFAVWFVYDNSGNPTWYTFEPGSSDGPNYYHGTIYRTTGPVGPFFGAATFDPSRVNQVAVGTGTLGFFDYANGSINYTIDGKQGYKHIERMPVE